jgi:hypothetical protein
MYVKIFSIIQADSIELMKRFQGNNNNNNKNQLITHYKIII